MIAPRPWMHGVALAALVALLALPQFAGRFYVQLFTEIMITAILAQSLGLLVAGVGLVSLGHAAFYGFAAYLVVLLTPEMGGASLWWLLPTVLAATAALALVIGGLVVRTQGVYTIMATLAFGQMVYFFFHDTPIAGGSDGTFLGARPTVTMGDLVLLDLGDRPTVYYLVLAALVLVVLFLLRLMQAPFGKAITGIRFNEPRMRALGYEPVRYKLVTFVIAGTIAGLAGFLIIVHNRFANPELLSWRESASVLLMVILGGTNSLYGPILGAFAFVLVEHWLVGATSHWALPMGLFIIAVVLLLPQGLISLPGRLAEGRDRLLRRRHA